MKLVTDVLIWLICFGSGFLISGYIDTLTDRREIIFLNEQIVIRDSTNANNIRIHKVDSIRIQWLFTHDRK